MLVGVASVFPTPANADESYCSDGHTNPGGSETVILGKPGDPLVLSVQTTPRNGAMTQVLVCYATGPNGSTGMLAAGSIDTYTYTYGAQGSEGYVLCHGDATATVSPDCRYDYGATSNASITPTYSTSGLTLTATIPFRVCVGSCVSDTVSTAATGLIVGTLVPDPGPAGSTGASYRLAGTKVILNGVTLYSSDMRLGGLFFDDRDAFRYGLTGYTYGPCTLGVCVPVPQGSISTTGNDPVVTLTPPTGSPQTITVPLTPVCVYDNNSGTACP
jgi:hypothetical protein